MKTLQELLEMKVDDLGAVFTPDFRVAVQGEGPGGGIHIIIHPMGYDGDTLDFVVVGNELTPMQ